MILLTPDEEIKIFEYAARILMNKDVNRNADTLVWNIKSVTSVCRNLKIALDTEVTLDDTIALDNKFKEYMLVNRDKLIDLEYEKLIQDLSEDFKIESMPEEPTSGDYFIHPDGRRLPDILTIGDIAHYKSFRAQIISNSIKFTIDKARKRGLRVY